MEVYYYIGYIEIPSALTKMEKELSECLRSYEYSVIAESELDRIILELQDKQTDLSLENPRLKQVDIRWTTVKYISSNVGASIRIGRNIVNLIRINQFVGVFHEPNDPEGISSSELKHQLFGAEVQKRIDIEKACKWIEKHFPGNGYVNAQKEFHYYNVDIFRRAMEG